MFDRFILRFDVGYLLRPGNLRMVLTSPDPTPAAPLGKGVLQKAQKEVAAIKLTDATVDVLIDMRDALKGEGFIASDRRWKKSLRLVQAAAYMAGAKETCPEDLTILVDALWREPKERPKIARLVGKLADPVGCQAMEILDAARETATKVQALKNSDRKQYLAQAGQALEEFRAQQTKLGELAHSGGSRAKDTITDAQAEVNGLHAELARAVSTGLGLGMRAVK
jgi:MoxR-like ATPase